MSWWFQRFKMVHLGQYFCLNSMYLIYCYEGIINYLHREEDTAEVCLQDVWPGGLKAAPYSLSESLCSAQMLFLQTCSNLFLEKVVSLLVPTCLTWVFGKQPKPALCVAMPPTSAFCLRPACYLHCLLCLALLSCPHFSPGWWHIVVLWISILKGLSCALYLELFSESTEE